MFYNTVGTAVPSAEDKETGPEDSDSSGCSEADEHNTGVCDVSSPVQFLHKGSDVRAVPADRCSPRLLDVHLHEELIRQSCACVCVTTTELFGAIHPHLGPNDTARSAEPNLHTVRYLRRGLQGVRVDQIHYFICQPVALLQNILRYYYKKPKFQQELHRYYQNLCDFVDFGMYYEFASVLNRHFNIFRVRGFSYRYILYIKLFPSGSSNYHIPHFDQKLRLRQLNVSEVSIIKDLLRLIYQKHLELY